MRTTAALLGILAALLMLGLGTFLYAIGFGQLENRIPHFWQIVFFASLLALAGGIAMWWRVPVGVALLAGSALIWLLLDWRMMQTLNLFASARGIISDIVIMAVPPGLVGLAAYLGHKSRRSPHVPPG